MEQDSHRTIEWQHLGLVVLGFVLVAVGAFVLAVEPGWTVSPVGAGAALIGAGLTLIITTVARRRREQRDEVVVDERVATIGEKSGYRAFQASFIAQGVLFAVVGVTTLELPLMPVLGSLFGFTGLVYVVAYNWYRRSM